MALVGPSLLVLLAGIGSEEPSYPLGGPLRLPPIAEPASPFRIVDLRYDFSEDGSRHSRFESRIRLGSSLFVGGEVAGARRGLSLDTQRIELGISEEEGSYEIEGAFRAPRFLLSARGLREGERWLVLGEGSLRFTPDLELVLTHAEDLDDSPFAFPTVEEFARTGVLPPPGPRSRELRSSSAGFLYQRGAHFEVSGDARLAKVKTEGAFDLDLERFRLAALWNRSRIQIEGETWYQTTAGRLPSRSVSSFLDLQTEIGSRFLGHASTLQSWEPGVLRFEESYTLGVTFFARGHRFARRGEAAARIVELQRRAVALGYNERRVYDVEGLRRFRERLGISPARSELADDLAALYRAQVRERNVPQLGFEVELEEDPLRGSVARGYRMFFGVPWSPALPFSRNEDAVEFITGEVVLRKADFGGNLRAVSREAWISLFLNREMSVRFQWERRDRLPEELVRGTRPFSRIRVSFDYALGR